MTNFFDAMTTDDSLTANGAVQHSTSGLSTLDMFFQIGAMRGRTEQEVLSLFTKAFGEDPLSAMKILFYNRDVRGGQGERRSFQVMAKYMAQMHPNVMRKNLHLISEFGRWDDLFVFVGTPLENDAFELIRKALLEGNGLAAKWCYREKSAKKDVAFKLRTYLGMSSKEYRKTLSRLTKVVETQMCSNEWDKINFSHVPSVAMKSYRKAFARHTPELWEKYISAIEAKDPSVKINASAIFPHDIVKQFLKGYSFNGNNVDIRAADAQWNALPDYMGNKSGKVMVVADVSGSMFDGINKSLRPIDASVSLALYCAERCKGAFKNLFLTFSSEPALVNIKGANIAEKIRNISTSNWGGSTDINRALQVMLDRANTGKVSQDDMPEVLLIISDMQFDSCRSGITNFDGIREQYRDSGYVMPSIVFWNVNASDGAPVKSNSKGVALVSGYSPSILSAILGGEMSPAAVFDRAINSGRYNSVTI